MLIAVTIGGLVLAVIVGVALRYAVTAGKPEKHAEGADVVKVLGSTSLIAGLLVGFVLSGASSSYTSARGAIKAEADTVDTLYESAEYVKQPFRQRLQGAAVCYARAVTGPGFDAMAHGDDSPVPSNWTGTQRGAIRRTLIDMTPSAVGFGDVRSSDVTRGNQRNQRLAEAQSTVPGPLFAMMVILLALSLGTLAYSIPRKDNLEEIVALVVVTMIFGAVLVLITNFDRPFGGILKLKPTAMAHTAAEDGADYVEAFHIQPPCDADGNPAKWLLKLRAS